MREQTEKHGYEKVNEWAEGIYDFSKWPLNYSLPKAFSFGEPGKYDMKKMIEASWKEREIMSISRVSQLIKNMLENLSFH